MQFFILSVKERKDYPGIDGWGRGVMGCGGKTGREGGLPERRSCKNKKNVKMKSCKSCKKVVNVVKKK